MRIAIVCALAVLAGCGEAGRAPVDTSPCRPSGECRLTFGGVAREYLRFAPRTGAAGRPLLVVLHGVGPGATPRAAAAETRLHEHGDAVVVYPAWAGDDLPFLKALIATVARRERTGPTYVVGYSGGGFMAHRMACALDVQAVAVLHAPLRGPCRPERAVAVLQIAGTADDVIPFAGGRTPEGFVAPSIRSSTARWRRIARGRAEVELIVVQDGGHIWYPDATETIRRFFAL